MILLYRIFFPLVFIFFIPGLLIKLARRTGPKHNYPERFGIFSEERAEALRKMKGAVWLHAVSVGETMVALTLLSEWMKENPNRKFVFSTTTTTGQEIAVKKVPPGVEVFFAPLDFGLFVRQTLSLIQPSALVIFETEIWPNMVMMTKDSGAKLVLVNARISDRSVKGYQRFKSFFAPILEKFDAICVQAELDRERFESITPKISGALKVSGNIKFDQALPAGLKGFDLKEFFGEGEHVIILASSTHSPEEALVIKAFAHIKSVCPQARLVIVPRHAERGGEIASWLEENKVSYIRRSLREKAAAPVECLLADTTGELLRFIQNADIVVQGKTFCGNNEGQNIIEPAISGKAIVSGPELKNFRQALDALISGGGIYRVEHDEDLGLALTKLINDTEMRNELGRRAASSIKAHSGALRKTIKILEETL